MSWSLDWFAAEKLAKAGAQIRRVSWTDHVFEYRGGMWFYVSGATRHIVRATDYSEADLRARDWTDEPYNANPCAAVPAYNSQPIEYQLWGDENGRFVPAPPPPGFPSL